MSRQDDWRLIRQHMRVPCFAAGSLLGFLAIEVLLGTIVPSRPVSYIIAGIAICMAITVLLFSMEARAQPPVMRLYASFGFVWFSILAGMTMLDYLTR